MLNVERNKGEVSETPAAVLSIDPRVSSFREAARKRTERRRRRRRKEERASNVRTITAQRAARAQEDGKRGRDLGLLAREIIITLHDPRHNVAP